MRDRKDMDTYIESKVEEFKKLPAEPSVFTGHDVLIKWVETALNQTAEKVRVEERERFGKILSEIESSLKTSNGGKEEIEGIIWTAHEALKANTTKN